MSEARTSWTPEHLIGGHPALDLTNTVFDRRDPAADNELLRSADDIARWLRATGCANEHQARLVADRTSAGTLAAVHRVRESAFKIFNDLVLHQDPSPEHLGRVMATAAAGLTDSAVDLGGSPPALAPRLSQPHGVAGLLALLTLDGYYTLPKDRLGSCPRCGWLFLDTSRGKRRRWCSMKTCGNREKVSRHRTKLDA